MHATADGPGDLRTADPRREARAASRRTETELFRAVTKLNAAFKAATLPLDLSDVGPLRAERAQVVEQMRDYLLPRLARPGAPALVVIGGPTGAGKSTLVNSLAGHKVTTPGLLRPTTRSPVLVHHPADAEWFGPDRVLPRLRRVDVPTTDQAAIQLVATPSAPRGLALLDAPDFDSIDDNNRELATKLLAAADLLLFVTSAARYSDQVPWQQLSLALDRDTAVAVVMNRIPLEDKPAVSSHLIQMLHAKDVSSDRVFFVDQGPVDDDGLLAPAYVAEIRAWLDGLASDVGSRSAAVRQTVRGAARRAIATAGPVADAAALQVEAVSELLVVAEQVYSAATDSLAHALSGGTLVRGELMRRWSELMGTQELASLGEIRDAVRERSAQPGTELPARADRLALALDMALETLVVDHAERAADRATRELRATAHGSALLAWSAEDLSRPGRGLGSRARQATRSWREGLVRLVVEELGDEAAAFGDAGARALAVAVVLHAVSASAGADDDEPPVVVTARTGVTQTLSALLAEERDRFIHPVLDWNLAPDSPARLRSAASAAARALVRHDRQEA